MSDRQLMQQVLRELEGIPFYRKYGVRIRNAITALQKRLAHCDRCGKKLGGEGDIHTCTPKPVQEPVAIDWDTKTDTPIMGYTTPPAAPVQPDQEPVLDDAAPTVQDQKSCKLCTHEQRHYMEMTGPCRACRFYSNFASAAPPAQPAPVQEPFSPEAISATQRAWQMGYEAAKAEMQTEQEPVAWIDPADYATLENDGWCVVHANAFDGSHALHSTPPAAAQRQWVGLTDDDIAETNWRLSADREYEQWTLRENLVVRGVKDFARAIEAKIMEKNT
jgi:hypothetical protein